jgi:hypothetical protein
MIASPLTSLKELGIFEVGSRAMRLYYLPSR